MLHVVWHQNAEDLSFCKWSWILLEISAKNFLSRITRKVGELCEINFGLFLVCLRILFHHLSFIFWQLYPREKLKSQYIDGGNHISSSTLWIIEEANRLSHNLFLKHVVWANHVLTSLLYQVQSPLIRLAWAFDLVFNCFLQNQEWNCHVLWYRVP